VTILTTKNRVVIITNTVDASIKCNNDSISKNVISNPSNFAERTYKPPNAILNK
jgi:hypothetical protein